MHDAEKAEALANARATHPTRRRQAAAGQETAEETFQKVIRFAREMGGFHEARAALDAVEKKLKELI